MEDTEDKIQGGYYIKARKIQESEIAHAPPHVREIWDWLLWDANWKDNGKLKRGQTHRTTKEIQEGLSWYVGWRKESYSLTLCENSMKTLKKAGMITTKRTNRGSIITISNYDRYQNPDNYESRTESQSEPLSETERKPDGTRRRGKKGEKGTPTSASATGPKKRDQNKKITAGQFEKFWELYPGKKVDKGKCLSKWKTISGWRKSENPPTWIQIKDAIWKQSQTERWQNGMIPLPHTWLNQRRWLDDPAEMKSQFKKAGGKNRHRSKNISYKQSKNLQDD